MAVAGALGLLLSLLLGPAAPAGAELLLPPGFTARVHVSGDGYESGRGGRGFPAASTLAADADGVLYVARTGLRYLASEGDDLGPVYRIPPGGAALTPQTEAAFLHGPPLRNAQVGALRGERELLLTTFDRDRKVGVLYRLLDGRATLLAGGTPPRGEPPLLVQPEGVAVDSAGRLYVADRARGAVLRLDPAGRPLDPRWLETTRPRTLAIDASDHLWVGADGGAEAPWQEGPGEIWRVSPRGEATRLLHGPVAAGIAASPGGNLLVADRHRGEVFALSPDGRRVDLLRFTDNDAPRSLAFVPVTPGTRRAGFAGDLLVVVINRGAWPVNEVVRVSGPFDELVRQRLAP